MCCSKPGPAAVLKCGEASRSGFGIIAIAEMTLFSGRLDPGRNISLLPSQMLVCVEPGTLVLLLGEKTTL